MEPAPLTSFPDKLNTVVIGASGGIGGAFVSALAAAPSVGSVLALSRSGRPVEGLSGPAGISSGVIDLEDEESIEHAATQVVKSGPLHLVIVATGILHADSMKPEKSWNALSADTMERAYRLNTVGPALVAKHFLPLLDSSAKSVFACLSARVGSIEDNALGGWYAYRASKAALNMVLRTLSIELARRNPAAVCLALHPGTVDTDLSKPFQANVPNSKLFTPDDTAEKLLSVIDSAAPVDSGNLFAWDGQRIPF